MAHKLNTNKQFMVGNGIMAFAVIFVVIIFVYMSLRLSWKSEERNYREVYTISLEKGFVGSGTSVYLNDSLLLDTVVTEEPCRVQVKRFAEQNALMIVDNTTERISLFELSQNGGTYRFEKEADEVKQLAMEK